MPENDDEHAERTYDHRWADPRHNVMNDLLRVLGKKVPQCTCPTCLRLDAEEQQR